MTLLLQKGSRIGLLECRIRKISEKRGRPMRRACLTFAILVLVCSMSFSQQSNSPSGSTATTASTPAKLSGCLMNVNGTFYLLTASRERFMLQGKHNDMFSHNGQQVEITVKHEQDSSAHGSPKTLTVTHIERVAQVCQ